MPLSTAFPGNGVPNGQIKISPHLQAIPLNSSSYLAHTPPNEFYVLLVSDLALDKLLHRLMVLSVVSLAQKIFMVMFISSDIYSILSQRVILMKNHITTFSSKQLKLIPILALKRMQNEDR